MRTILFFLSLVTLIGCTHKKLPVYGNKVLRVVDGTPQTDSIDYTIPDFNFVDQDNNTVSHTTVQNKIYVADFFFTSCPSICPKMKKEMLRIYEKYRSNDQVLLLSYSIDPTRDSVARLKQYAQKLNVSESSKWHFLTGNKDSIYTLATSYLVEAGEQADAPGGHIHDGNFILIDKHRRIRGYYDGTKEEKVTQLLSDMDILLEEK